MLKSLSNRTNSLAFIFFLIVSTLGFFRFAWVTEDAFINFRAMENFLDGNGLVWNIGERVQVFTSPLWFMSSLALSSITGEFYYTTVVFSLALTLGTFLLLYAFSEKKLAIFLPAALLLASSVSFRDYSSSGLETPLVAFSIALFLTVWNRHHGASRAFWLVFLSCICALVRHDTAVFTFPFLVHHFSKYLSSRSAKDIFSQARQAGLGTVPFLTWSVFAVLYYGSFFPNTATAKIVPSTSELNLVQQALSYYKYMLHFDPAAYFMIGSSAFLGLSAGSRMRIPYIAALTLFVAYMFSTGGDYMAGRFFVPALVLSTFLFIDSASLLCKKHPPLSPLTNSGPGHNLIVYFCLLLITTLHLISENSNRYGRKNIVDGIADERSIYHSHTDFISVFNYGLHHPFKDAGLALRHISDRMSEKSIKSVAIACNVGMLGYFSGPDLHIIDPLALSDPFLPRLLPRGGEQRVGHFERLVPIEYIKSILSGDNKFSNKIARAYFDDVQRVVRGPIFSIERLHSIWRLNSGAYRDPLRSIDVEAMGGGVLASGQAKFRMHSCLGREFIPAYIAAESDLDQNGLTPAVTYKFITASSALGGIRINPAYGGNAVHHILMD